MEYGLFTCGYQRTKLSKAFADAKAFGYSYVEVSGGRATIELVTNYMDDPTESFKRAIRNIRTIFPDDAEKN